MDVLLYHNAGNDSNNNIDYLVVGGGTANDTVVQEV